MPGRPNVYVVTMTGLLTRALAVYAEVMPDGSVEVYWLDLDLDLDLDG